LNNCEKEGSCGRNVLKISFVDGGETNLEQHDIKQLTIV
jgi:hypothetical protein